MADIPIIDLASAPTQTIWFEFLLEPDKLSKHLDSNDEPNPWELIELFFNVNFKQPPSLTPQQTLSKREASVDLAVAKIKDFYVPDKQDYKDKKVFALQLLALKVASHLEWDMETICSNLSISMQYKLMAALREACSASSCPEAIKRFGNVTYWHWFVKAAISFHLDSCVPSNNTTIIYLSPQQQQQNAAKLADIATLSALFSAVKEDSEINICYIKLTEFLSDSLGANQTNKKLNMRRPTIDCFNCNGKELCDWSKNKMVKTMPILAAVSYDLGRYYFFQTKYKEAHETLLYAKKCNVEMPDKYELYLNSSLELMDRKKVPVNEGNCEFYVNLEKKKNAVEKYIFDCMALYSSNQNAGNQSGDGNRSSEKNNTSKQSQDTDLRFDKWYESSELSTKTYLDTQEAIQQNNLNKLPIVQQQQQSCGIDMQRQYLIELGTSSMAHGNFKQAMAAYLGALILMTDYFRMFTRNYSHEVYIIERMIQCSIQLGCFTQAVALCQMAPQINYGMAIKQLNERVCNDSREDIYECIWDITLLEFVINMHAKRNELELKNKAIHLMGNLELNESNSIDVLQEAQHHRRGRLLRMLANKYM